ncbi:MAG: hypothetical protein RL653_2158 [Pseudomonadota bacterium]|jgi:hypothetical protein
MRHASLAVLLLAAFACSRPPPPATAFKVQGRADLVGGQRALGEIGDYKITNGVIQAIVQDVGTSRGFGAFGGSLIDVDLVRGASASAATGPKGKDGFTEMFPAFFLQAIEPSKVEVLADGKDGKAAVVRVSGGGGDFVSIAKPLNETVIPQVPLAYTVDYILEPGKQYLKILVTMTNLDASRPANFPLSIPFGFITLLGEGQRLFVPGEPGFDMRYYLEEVAYKRESKLDALPGAVSSMWATEGDSVSYALVSGRRGPSYMAANAAFYPGAKSDSLLIPVSSSSFLGSFWARAPDSLPAGQSFSFSGYLAVGNGDIASVQRVAYAISDERERTPTTVAEITGQVTESGTGAAVDGISVVLQDAQGRYLSQARTEAGGYFSAPVPPGRYRAVAVDGVRDVGTGEYVDVAEGSRVRTDVQVDAPGQLAVIVRDDEGRLLPSKISVEGTYAHTGAEPPRKFLYDLKVGERYRASDFEPDSGDPASRRYLEKIFFAPKGSAVRALRPGKYTVYASRGIEYTLEKREVEITARGTTTVEFGLTHVMKTPKWISGDFHVHSVNSVDSDMKLDDRVTSYAAEGVDLVSSTDHNFVTDFAPTVEALGLSDWLHSVVGLELTTLEMGHFNAFPLELKPGPITHGSFEWFRRPPGELFQQLRGLGKDPQRTIVQVNHPRDTILGYFNGFNVDSYEGVPLPPDSLFSLDQGPLPDGRKSPYHPDNFSLDFDAMEVFNGKRTEVLFSYRMPATAPEGPEPDLPACPSPAARHGDCLPPAGEVLQKNFKVPQPDGTTKLVPQPAFPGAQDDWFTLLARGHRVTATGNSDSHSAGAEAGLPRTYIFAGDSSDGSMRGLSEDAAMQALRDGKASATNGPFIEVTVNGKGLGETVVAPDGKISVQVKVQAAPWVDVTRVVVRRGGADQFQRPEVLEEIPVPASDALVRLDVTREYTGIPDGSFIVVEAAGDRPMWPVFTPYELGSLEISDALYTLAGSFGFSKKFGKYEPQRLTQVRPYGFTNPVWVNRVSRLPLTRERGVLPVGGSAPFHPRTLADLRKIFGAFHADPE